MKFQHLFLLPLFCFNSLYAQNDALHSSVQSFFEHYAPEHYRPRRPMSLESIDLQTDEKQLIIHTNSSFSSQVFTPENVDYIYRTLQSLLPTPYRKYRIQVRTTRNILIEDLIPNAYLKDNPDKEKLLRKTDYDGLPWVSNTSRPYQVTQGLQNRHLFIWASHGNYFKEDRWKWQRPYLFCTTEDLFTQSFVYPFLFPMLENAGAIIGTPRERDYQPLMTIVDNDANGPDSGYAEQNGKKAWQSSAAGSGFKPVTALLNDSIFPFKEGTYRYTASCSDRRQTSDISWTPTFQKEGRYAVYVSYAASEQNIPDAQYTVYHKGGSTTFSVNQQMGGHTWVYLGTFEFDPSTRLKQGVTLSNYSRNKGQVTADAVRFGGGIGQTARGTCGTSGLPRYLEAARYYAQWAGIPDTLVHTTDGLNDYVDDLRVRGNMVNYLGGGSIYLPRQDGQKVPFELALALHSDAGIQPEHRIYGSLSIGTTQVGDSLTTYPTGLSRRASSDFSAMLLRNLTQDLSQTLNISWAQREHWDRNYAETRMPLIPSAILEMLSHQNFTDMTYGHDPNFKFTLARSVYKSILRYLCTLHGVRKYSVQPLPVQHFAAELTADGKQVKLSWQPTADPAEPTAQPQRYILYTRKGDQAFDNGQDLGNSTGCLVHIEPDTPYAFRITAVNEGGESFPSETLSAFHTSKGNKRVLIVNGFKRLSGPAQKITPTERGFDLDLDFGVPYLSTTAFSGRQLIYDVAAAGLADSIAWGLSGQEWVGRELKGNTFDYPVCHGQSIASSGRYSYCSVSREAFEQPGFDTGSYQAIDYIAGLEGDFGHNLRPYKALPAATRQKLTDYLHRGGALLLSGAFIASDCQQNEAEKNFIREMLQYRYAGSMMHDPTTVVKGLNMSFDIYREPNGEHYPAQHPDVILPASDKAFPCFVYGDGHGAGVAYRGDRYRTLTMSFPFECISSPATRHAAMTAILSFLTE